MVFIALSEISPTVSHLSSRTFNHLAKNKRFFVEDPRFFWMKHLARFKAFRTKHNSKDYFTDSKDSTVKTPTGAGLFTQHPLPVIHRMLWQDGYYQGLRLDSSLIDSLLLFAQTHSCYGDRDPNIKFMISQQQQIESALGRHLKCASYFNSHVACDAFQQLKQNPILQSIAAEYLGRQPKYQRSELAWNFPTPSTEASKLANAQVLHCDVNDYRTVKFFFYLTDVDVDSGPHIYIQRSHHSRSLWHQLLGQRIASIPDQQLVQRYGAEHVMTVCGPAGFGFVGDPYVLHQGTTPNKHPRLLLQLEFGINTYKTWYFA